MTALRRLIDPYLLMLIGTVLLAALLPARGQGAVVTEWGTTAAVALLFFLYGARLSPAAIWAGLSHWRLQSLVLASTFVLFPLIGLGVHAAFGRWLAPEIGLGLLYLCLLPSTVQSSIAFTSIARGNVPAALCSASVSNLIGVVITPFLVSMLLPGTGGGGSLKAVVDIAVQILLPFAVGQAARPLIGAFLARHARLVGIVDRGSILLVVYGAFSAGMVAGVWGRLGVVDLVAVIGLDILVLALVIVATTVASRRLGFSKEDEIAIVFCGSKKSMASGIPMAAILFPGAAVSLVVLPLMLFHQIQLFVCAVLARRYAERPAIEN
ncbi:bile acid:sodium symporter [soil metagenome]